MIMRGRALRSLGFWLVFLTACGPSLTWTRRAPSQARPADCVFDVIDVGPRPPLREIGVIEIDSFSLRALPRSEASFRKLIAKEVCKVGGDAVIPGVNGFGRYVLATVVTFVTDTSFPPVVPGGPGAAQSSGDELRPQHQGRAPW
jgi:hypothetical protein